MLDRNKLSTSIDNLLFLWYDEDNDNFVEMDTTYADYILCFSKILRGDIT